jgi:hypothetical protein
MIGNAGDKRTGTGFAQAGAPPVDIAATKTTADALYLYVAPEARIGYRLGRTVEIAAGVEFALMVALKEARWDPNKAVVVGNQGLATYPDAALFGSTLILLNPGVTARFEF